MPSRRNARHQHDATRAIKQVRKIFEDVDAAELAKQQAAAAVEEEGGVSAADFAAMRRDVELLGARGIDAAAVCSGADACSEHAACMRILGAFLLP